MSIEKKVAEFLDERSSEILEFARDLIRTPSVNPPGDERAVADLVVDRLATLGVDDATRVGADDARPNLIVRITGDRPGPTLMLSGPGGRP